MADPRVLEAQQWLNQRYCDNAQYNIIPEDGVPGTSVMMALVEALQIDLGMAEITGIFGNTTYNLCPTLQYGDADGESNAFVTILQHGLFCKGYNPSAVSGKFLDNTESAVKRIQQDAGLDSVQITSAATPLVMQAILSTEYYKRVFDGDQNIREMQRMLNRKYLSYTHIRACDGVFSRSSAQAVILAIQAEEGLPVEVANGNFGETTKACCPHLPYGSVEKDYNNNNYNADRIKNFTCIMQYLLYCNGWRRGHTGSRFDPVDFDGHMSGSTIQAIRNYQAFVALPTTYEIGLNEWLSLAVSTGNPNREGTAIDCATRLSKQKIVKISTSGYSIIGRYLTGDIIVNGKRIAKNLLRSEMKDIFGNGMSLFVIFQDSRQYYTENPEEESIKNYFSEERGFADAEKAFSAAKSLGVPHGEVIYFAVDYDFMESQVISRIVPHFKGINDYCVSTDSIYKIGIYGSRNTCSLVKEAGYSFSSFVSDMSTGYSGNIGFMLPDDWAFDQIQEYMLSTPEESFGIDKNVVSGRYLGFNSFMPTEQDNEWDLIGKNGTAYVLMTGQDDMGITEIPMFWSKVKNSQGEFLAKYPMYDKIQVNAFYSARALNRNRPDALGDKIRYVYFRDVGGSINGGYIDTTSIGDYFEKPLCANLFGEVHVIYQNGTPTLVHIAAPQEESPIHFTLAKPVNYYSSNGSLQGLLEVNTQVELLADSFTGQSYPYMIQCTQKKLSGSDVWQSLVPGASFGYLDLGFEIGVMPNNRAYR